MKACLLDPTCPFQQSPPPSIEVLTKHWPTHLIEDTVKKNKAAKVKKSAMRQEQVRKAAGAAIKAYATDRALRMAALERAVKSAPDHPAFKYQLSHLLLKQGREDDMRAARGLPPLDQASAIQAAAAPAMRNALGVAINRGPIDQRGSLVAAFTGNYKHNSPADSFPNGDPTLPSLRENHEIVALEKQLDEAQSAKGPDAMQRASQLSYMLTRARLAQGHRDGSLRGIGR
jgi:hypothetical protein